MYCPVCFNHTLKIAHRGVVKVAINGKSKSTSQFIYNLSTDKPGEIDERFSNVLKEYFNWYKTLRNLEVIKTIDLTSCDFVCSDGCKLTFNHMLNVVDLVISKESYLKICEVISTSMEIPISLQR
jgi:hypothetical protein